MIATWMFYHTAFVALLGLAAAIAELPVLQRRLPSRWLWTAVLGGAVAVPPLLIGRRILERPEESATEGGVGEIIAASGSLATELAQRIEGVAPGLAEWDGFLLNVWLGGSILLAVILLFSGIRLALIGRHWRRLDWEGGNVWVTENAGPAVVGLLRPKVVVPRWTLELPPRQRELMLAHEREHVRAGDVRLLLAAYALLVAVPWNPGVWWTVRRLRDAIEYDCDQRVLESGSELRTYGLLLLSVGSRPANLPLNVAALSRGRTQLERRVRMMARTQKRSEGFWTTGAMLAATALVVVACEMDPPEVAVSGPGARESIVESSPEVGEPPQIEGSPRPAEQMETPPPPPEPAAAAPAAQRPERTAPSRQPEPRRQAAPSQAPDVQPDPSVTQEPVFTPMDVRPELRNRSAFVEQLERRYPPMLKDAGIGGTAVLWVFIDERGEVQQARVNNSSGYEQLDRVAEQIMLEVAQFTAARNREQAVPVWIQIPVTFQTR